MKATIRLHKIHSWRLTEDNGQVWLFTILDDRHLPNLRAYTSQDLRHHLSTALRGQPALLSNTTGLRLAVLLSKRPHLPNDLAFPGWRKGLVQIGQGVNSAAIVTDWEKLGHVLCAGITGSGKSNFLRLVAGQVIAEGHKLMIGDLRGRTFGVLAEHASLFVPIADSLGECADLVQSAVDEMNRRDGLYRAMRGAPETLDEYNAVAAEPLPRLVVMLNEYNSLVLEMGGPKSDLTHNVSLLTTQGRGYGFNVILAGQKFQRDVVGAAQDQCRTRICFQVQKPSTSRVVLDRNGAERLKTPGRALTDPWGLVQVYNMPKEQLASAPGGGMTPDEKRIAAWIHEHANGRLTLKALTTMGLPEREARRLREDWSSRGLAVKRPEEDNALCLAEFASQPPWASKPVQTVQTEHNKEIEA